MHAAHATTADLSFSVASTVDQETDMNKRFDSVELQHRGAEKVQERLATMTLDEQVEYWAHRGEELRKRKVSLSKRKESS